MTPQKIMVVVGARPNFVKAAPLIQAMGEDGRFDVILIHTGQHYDHAMSDAFFADLEMPRPDKHLEVGSGSHAWQTAEVMRRFEEPILEHRPRLVIVVGDVNSTLACALVAAKLGVEVAHIEAGLRSFDRSMPEEINRVVTDVVSNYLFTSCEDAKANLLSEGLEEGSIFFVGNLMIDTLLRYEQAARDLDQAAELGLPKGDYALLTLHRPSNVDDPVVLGGIVSAITEIQRSMVVVFPMHPRTQKRLAEFGFLSDIERQRNIRLLEPMTYLAFLSLMCCAGLVLTDSGGIQEETTALRIPCLTLRENTERPVTITLGTNRLVGTDPADIAAAVSEVRAESGEATSAVAPLPLWDGQAARRTVHALRTVLG